MAIFTPRSRKRGQRVLAELAGALLEQRTLGELERDELRPDAVLAHGLLDELAQLGALELHGGHVHAHRHEVRALLAPRGDVAADAIEHELADRE